MACLWTSSVSRLLPPAAKPDSTFRAHDRTSSARSGSCNALQAVSWPAMADFAFPSRDFCHWHEMFHRALKAPVMRANVALWWAFRIKCNASGIHYNTTGCAALDKKLNVHKGKPVQNGGKHVDAVVMNAPFGGRVVQIALHPHARVFPSCSASRKASLALSTSVSLFSPNSRTGQR